MSDRLQGDVALITGAGSGIGAATAIKFSNEGATVVLCGRRSDKLNEVADQVLAQGGHALVVPTDVADEHQFSQAVSRTVKELGHLDILVNNAMSSDFAGLIDNTSTESWHTNFAATLDGAFFGTRAVLPHMRAQGGGSIVNVSSVAGIRATPGTAGYSAAKSALITLTRNTAIEGAADNIRANAIVPGVVKTPALDESLSDEDGLAHTAASVPLKRIADPSELADAILFLASDEASYITGVSLPVDGGRTCEIYIGAVDYSER